MARGAGGGRGTNFLGLCVGVGVALGTGLGVVFDNLALGIGMGVALGAGIGAALIGRNGGRGGNAA